MCRFQYSIPLFYSGIESNLSFDNRFGLCSNSIKHNQNNSPDLIISTSVRILSMCLRAATMPCRIRILKYSNMSEPRPPITSTNSGVSLNGDVSKPRLRGDVDKMNPKSMWIRCPSPSNNMLPLCLLIRYDSLVAKLNHFYQRLHWNSNWL